MAQNNARASNASVEACLAAIVDPARRKDCEALATMMARSIGQPARGKLRDPSVFYGTTADVDAMELQRWLGKSRDIQWDYRNIVKRKGRLERLK